MRSKNRKGSSSGRLWITVTGPKKSGKTSTIEALVPYLQQRGYRVATLKHTVHQHVFDKPGTDSHRHTEAGAGRVGIVSPGELVLFAYDANEEERETLLLAFFRSYDVILCEGFRDSPYPKIVLEGGEEPLGDVSPPVIVQFEPIHKSGRNSEVPGEILEKIAGYIEHNLKRVAQDS